MGIKDLLRKRAEKGERFKQMIEEVRMQKQIEQRMKSPQERELENFLERKRQEQIKIQVDDIRAQERREMFSGGLSPEKNIFKGHKSILGGKKLFRMKAARHEGGMFLKWNQNLKNLIQKNL